MSSWIILVCLWFVVDGLSWTEWHTHCNGSTCYQSRYVSCKAESSTQFGTPCVGDGEIYYETRTEECSSKCPKWSRNASVSACTGHCHNAGIAYRHECTTIYECVKTQYRKCVNKGTCTGTWFTYRIDSCNNTCGIGAQTLWQRCIKNSQTSKLCLGTYDRTTLRKVQQQCDNCKEWSQWSWTHCNASCIKSKTRTCISESTSFQCINKDFTESESCTEDECKLLSTRREYQKNTKKSYPILDNRYYLILVAGGVILGIVAIFVTWFVVKRRQNKVPKMDDNKTGQVYITEIDRFSPTADGKARKRYSFGSHYETIEGDVYSEPFDSLAWKQKRAETKTTNKEIYAVPRKTKKRKPKNPQSPIPSYRDSMHAPDADRTIKFFDEEIYTFPNNDAENTKQEPIYSSIDKTAKYKNRTDSIGIKTKTSSLEN